MMDLTNISTLKNLCKKYQLVPSSHYGQNFLINRAPIEAMLEAAKISKNDMVVEIGPGFGVLTEALASHCQKVLAFEIEQKIKPYWEASTKKNVEIIWGNILREENLLPTVSYKLVANLPYQITSNVIRLFLESNNKPEVMVLMVQKEVAERICAKPGDMSILAVSVQYYADPEIIQMVPRGNFWPEPAVDSAIIRITPKKDGQGDDKYFFKAVKTGFSNRRKLLIKNLLPLAQKDGLFKLNNIFSELGFDKNVRAQELSIADWKKLVEHVTRNIYVIARSETTKQSHSISKTVDLL